MGRQWLAAALFGFVAVAPAAAADDPLAMARQLYNNRQFLAAVNAAELARRTPMHADAADLVAARAYLERYRESSASDDLTNARERLRRIDPQRVSPRERTEYLVGLGEALYFDGGYGAAAAQFDSVLRGPELLSGPARERVLEWWANAVDHDARPRPEMDRQAVYQRLRSRLEDDLAVHPSSAVASYWLIASARAQGDLQAAMDAAEAAWVRSALAADGGAALRVDVDRVVTLAIIPERARASSQSPDSLKLKWEEFKKKWEKSPTP
jgi:hypothetical protein